MRRTARPEGLPPAPRSALLRRLVVLALCAAGWVFGLILATAGASHADQAPAGPTRVGDLLDSPVNGLVRTAEDVRDALPHTLDRTVRRTLRGTVDTVTATVGDTPRVLGRPGPGRSCVRHAVRHAHGPCTRTTAAARPRPPARTVPHQVAAEPRVGHHAATGAAHTRTGARRPSDPRTPRAISIDLGAPVPYAPAAPASITAGPAASSSSAAGPAFSLLRASGWLQRPGTPPPALRPVRHPHRAPAGDPRQTPD